MEPFRVIVGHVERSLPMSSQTKRGLAVLIPVLSLMLLGVGWVAWRHRGAHNSEAVS